MPTSVDVEGQQATFSVVGFTDIGGDKWEKPVGLTKKYTFDETTGILTLGASAQAAVMGL